MVRLLRRYARTTVVAFAVLALLAVALSRLRLDIPLARSGPGTGQAEPVWGTQAVGQVFRVERDGLSVIEVALLPSAKPETAVEVSLARAGQRAPLRTVRGPVAQFLRGPEKLRFEFPAVTGVTDATVVLTLAAPEATPEEALMVRYDPADDTYVDGYRTVQGDRQSGDLGFTALRRATTWEVLRIHILEGRAGQWMAAVAVGIMALLLTREWRRGISPARPWRVFLLGSMLLSLLYTFPILGHMRLWAPDESDWAEATATIAATRQTIAMRQFPGWNPYICGGTPNMANPQTYLLPFALPLSFLVGDVVATKLEFTIMIALGLLGMFALAHTLEIRGVAALLACVVFLLSGFTTTHLANGQVLWLTLAWVPWVLQAFLRSVSRTAWWCVISAFFLSLIFVEGRVYLVAYLALFLVLLAGILAVRDRRVRPITMLLCTGVLTVGLSAWKLLPSLAFLVDAQRSLPNTDGLPLSALDDAFLGRNLRPNEDVHFDGDSLPRHEVAAYVGVLPLLLALVSLRRETRRRAVPFLVAGSIFLLLAMQRGEASLLEHIPLARELRNPSRMISMVVLVIAVLSGLGLSSVKPAGTSGRWRFTWVIIPAVITAVVLADVLYLGWVHLAPLFRVHPQVIADMPPGFFQTRLPERQPSNGYPTVAAGKGARDFCPAVLRAYRLQTVVTAREDAAYRGEVFARADARIEEVRLTPNTIDTRVRALQADTIIVNQQYDRGWSARPFPVHDAEGLIGIDVPAGDHLLQMQYRTPSLGAGVATTAGTFVLLGALWAGRRRRFSPR